jgi:hypothetical protein
MRLLSVAAAAALLAASGPRLASAQTPIAPSRHVAQTAAESAVVTDASVDDAIENLNATAGALSRIAFVDANELRLVALDDAEGDDDAQVRLLTHIREAGPVVANLRGSLAALTVNDTLDHTSTTMPRYLDAQGVDPARVVAARLAPSGLLTIFYR